jgi:hypothetical protein
VGHKVRTAGHKALVAYRAGGGIQEPEAEDLHGPRNVRDRVPGGGVKFVGAIAAMQQHVGFRRQHSHVGILKKQRL